MKVAVLLLLGCLLAWVVHAQTPVIEGWTVDGGGTTSTGGLYTASGTAGQPDAGALEGGGYTLVGGFWSFAVAIRTPGAPQLEITHTNGLVIVSWRQPARGFVLDHTLALNAATPGWMPVTRPYRTNATHISVEAPFGAATGFYRLRRP